MFKNNERNAYPSKTQLENICLKLEKSVIGLNTQDREKRTKILCIEKNSQNSTI